MPYPDDLNAAMRAWLSPTREARAAEAEAEQEELNSALDGAQNEACRVCLLVDNASSTLGDVLYKLQLIATDDEAAKPSHIAAIRDHEPHLLAAARAFAMAVAEFRIAVEAA